MTSETTSIASESVPVLQTNELRSDKRKASVTEVNTERTANISTNTKVNVTFNGRFTKSKLDKSLILQVEYLNESPEQNVIYPTSSDNPHVSPTRSLTKPGNTVQANHSHSASSTGDNMEAFDPDKSAHAQTLNDETDSPLTSPTEDVFSPVGSMPSSDCPLDDFDNTTRTLTSDASKSPRSSRSPHITTQRESVTATARARVVSDKTENRLNVRHLSEPKPRNLARCASEADMTTSKRTRSKTLSGSSYLKSPKTSTR